MHPAHSPERMKELSEIRKNKRALRKVEAGADTQTKIEKLKRIKKLRAQLYHLDFINYTWQNKTDPFVIGLHTRGICKIIDEAIEDYKQGKSSFHIIQVPFRHGKSEIISRKLPAHFLGLFPDGKVLMTGHTNDLAVEYSKHSRDLIKTAEYTELFPKVSVNPNDSSSSHWKIYDYAGECFASGLLGGLAGQGYALGILDDYCRNRMDAESPTMRNRSWEAVTNDFLTRRAPVSITIILATPWNIDDVIGRIKKKMEEDKYFPRFKITTFPAFSDDYEQGILFPERFDKEWYDQQRATLGEYGTASLLQMNPITRGGNLIDVSNIVKHRDLSEYPTDLRWYRVWDLAHTAKERNKPDPDYTSGTLLAFRNKPGTYKVWELWIRDIIRARMNAPERDNLIRHTAEVDGASVKIGIEDTIDSKDAYQTLSKIFEGRRMIQSAKGKGDKVTRMAPLEPIFKAGNVHVPMHAPWLNAWFEELSSFPSGSHDDMVDNLSAGYAICCKTPGVSTTTLMGV